MHEIDQQEDRNQETGGDDRDTAAENYLPHDVDDRVRQAQAIAEEAIQATDS